MRILIATEPDDTHALSVKLALQELGHTCDFIFTADMPSKQTNSLYINNKSFAWLLSTVQENAVQNMNENFEVVWWRRPRKPFIPDYIHPNDLECVKKENMGFHEATNVIIASDAWWVNPYNTIQYATSKIYQLKHAKACNLKIPTTLISNTPLHIKNFIDLNNTTIYKPFAPHNWHENDVLRASYTQTVTIEQLPSDAVLQLTPGIFQEKIEKAYELRVTCFGDFLVAIKIYSQEHIKSQLDWRLAPTHELRLEPYELPKDTADNIRSFMRYLGIVFGCFDFIVTKNNEIYFLEVNQQGQFLWVEDILPEIPMLDIFIKFLLNKKRDFQWNNNINVKLSDYNQEIENLATMQINQHVYLNSIKKKDVAS